MKNTQYQYAMTLTFVTATLLNTPAFATNLTSKLCTSGDTVVCLSETYDPVQSEHYGSNQSYYSVTNNTNQRIFGFGVTNSSGTPAYISYKYQGAWSAATLSQEQWDSGEIAFGSKTSSGESQLNWVSGTQSINGSAALGSFAQLFGENTTNNGDSLYVNFYWNFKNYYMLDAGATIGANYPGSGWRTNGQFYFQGLPESTATFFSQSGSVIASTTPSATDPLFSLNPSSIAAVPEPQTYLMLAIGLGMISLVRKRI